MHTRLKVAIAILVCVWVGTAAHDTYQAFTRTGRYQATWSGTVVSTERNALAVLKLLAAPSRLVRRLTKPRSPTVNHGDYDVHVTGDDGASMTVSVSEANFMRLRPPCYVVMRNGVMQRFADRGDAERSGAVPPTPR